MKNPILVGAIIIVVAFLLGFIPQYVKAHNLESSSAPRNRLTRRNSAT